MKSITEQTGHERDRLREVVNHLRTVTEGMSYNELFDDYLCLIFRGRRLASGKVSDELLKRLDRMPTEEEIIILVDRGFSHFGASCTIVDRAFSCTVYTD